MSCLHYILLAFGLRTGADLEKGLKAGLSVGCTRLRVSTQAYTPLMLHVWMITRASVNFCLPVKLFCFQNTPILNESLITYGNNPLWSREEKEAILEHVVETYIWHQTDGKRSQPNELMSVRNIVNIVDEVHATLDQNESRSEDSEFKLFQEDFKSDLDWSNILTFLFLLL